MWFLIIIFGLVAAQQTSGVIYRLEPAEYEKLPMLIDVEEYEPCMRGPGDVYCLVTAQLYGNNTLYNTLVEYSKASIKHFDHTHFHRGVCPKHSCQQHMKTSSNLTEVIEACLNESFTKDYGLTTKIMTIGCKEYHETTQFDTADYAFGVVLLILLGLNLLGTMYDYYCHHGKDETSGKYLLSFSLRENWRRLTAPPSSEPYQRRLRVLFGLKTLTSFAVIAAHVGVPYVLMSNNPYFVEKAYDSWIFVVLINSSHIVQVFFFSSALLMAYNKLKGERKNPTTWQKLPKDVLDRWLRLTPVYAFLTFYVMTWARHSAEGPFSVGALDSEWASCRQNWWRHLLYIDNYKDNSQCMIQAWYVSADFQLSVLGLTLFALLSSHRARKLVIGAGILVGLVATAAHVYFQDLPAVLLVTPELILNFFVADPTFNNLYKRGHTNIVCYALGLGFAYILFNLKESDIGAEKYKKYRTLYWFLGPLMLVVISCGMVFYVDGIAVPLGVRMVYSGVVKLLFGVLIALLIFFTAVKVDVPFRSFLNWRGWVSVSRLTYSCYLVHVPLLRLSTAQNQRMVHGTVFSHIHNYFGIMTMSFLLAVPLFILVEAPLSECTRLMLNPSRKQKPNLPNIVAESKETVEMKL